MLERSSTMKKKPTPSTQRRGGKTRGKAKQAATAPAAAVEPTPTPAALAVVIGKELREVKRDVHETVWFFTIVQGTVEHHAAARMFDSEAKAQQAGELWLAKYTKAGEAARRKMLGWKHGAPGSGPALTPEVPKAVMPTAAPKAKKEKPPKRTSLLDAAATVLAAASEPLNVKQMLERVVEQGLWEPRAGKTPHATLSAAILRERATKGDAARFNKTDRGMFTATPPVGG
jgi:hypothetical protein